MTTSNGGPAFPPSNPGYAHGMTLRDYFAAKAMQSYILHVDYRTFPDALLARNAYLLADAMLKAREV